MDWIEVNGEGKLITFSKLMYGPTGFENDLPYTIAIVQFGDIKVLGRMSKEIPDEEIKIGMGVKVSPLQLPEGRITYEFKKA